MLIRRIADADRPWIREVIQEHWRLPVVSISGTHDPSRLDGFVALEDGDRRGLITYRIDPEGCEVISLNSLWEGQGTGGALLQAVRYQVAIPAGLRLWLITTNDNVRAIGFYQRLGMDLVQLHRDFADEVAQHKSFPPPGPGQIRFRHALEFEFPSPAA